MVEVRREARRPRLAIVTPAVNRRGGTEKCLSWLVEDLSWTCEVTVLSGEVADTDVSRATVRRLTLVPRPRLLRYLTFLAANTLALLPEHPAYLLVVGRDDLAFYPAEAARLGVAERVRFRWLHVRGRAVLRGRRRLRLPPRPTRHSPWSRSRLPTSCS